MFIHRITAGRTRVKWLLRHSFRDGANTSKLTLANLSKWTDEDRERLSEALQTFRRHRRKNTPQELEARQRLLSLLSPHVQIYTLLNLLTGHSTISGGYRAKRKRQQRKESI